jgi:hypothetical protein
MKYDAKQSETDNTKRKLSPFLNILSPKLNCTNSFNNNASIKLPAVMSDINIISLNSRQFYS